jgi:hypothetical protein
LNLRPLGYEQYDGLLWRLGSSPVAALTTADRLRVVSDAQARLPRLRVSRRVSFTNPLTNTGADLRLPTAFGRKSTRSPPREIAPVWPA